MCHTKETLDLESTFARASSVEVAMRAAKVLRDIATEIERRAAEISDPTLSEKDGADRLTWIINDLASNVLTNCRMDIMAIRCAELRTISALRRAAKYDLDADELARALETNDDDSEVL